jgi:pimeloyl-ACP methyl ester carboxylesterase
MTTFLLVPGMWLGGWAWREVAGALREAGHDARPVTLTGLAERAHLGGPGTDLEVHITDITALIEVEELAGVVLVGHSYAGAPVTGAADRLAGRVSRVVYVDCGPLPDGVAAADFNPPEVRARNAAAVREGWRSPPPPFDPQADPALLTGGTPAPAAPAHRVTAGAGRPARPPPPRPAAGRRW